MVILQYAILGASFLISKLENKDIERLNNVILFGSVAAGTAAKESDIDLFFDVDMPKSFQLILRSKLNKSADDFYQSQLSLLFRMKATNNQFSIHVGKLSEWEDLEKSISSTGIIVYGKYTKKPSQTKSYTILSWKNPGKSKGALLNKIYGYKAKKRYPGILKKYSGTKIGMATIMVPSEFRDVFIRILEKRKANYSRFDVWM